jgi:hypothetical protein
MLLKFDYQIPAWRMIMGIIICPAIAFFMANQALTNQKPLRLLHALSLSVEVASIFFWVLSIAMIVAAILMGVLLAKNLKGPVSIVIEETHITAPNASLKNEMLSIPYHEISQVLVQDLRPNQQMVTINSSIGQARLMSIGFKSRDEFASFKKALAYQAGRGLQPRP